ncbi:TetR/AcrR family transcriptional regulator [Streptomyces gardneri]|jgi:AcrR family transcriptional regulator|uniref:TetR/AcrR family transcriptional regulator n=1 Tax=Nocardia sputi TaxID=2943705 RepID=UPI001895EE2F|nr:TetR/AcrR family transcriptional regulator [Nocardia sputi]MBF6167650.1 TetR/AcrR family transcriptional regulator [Streptomyces gardneri]MBF6206426.1 TetR/AcrR family transcriptional regulator [Streptomyces gardneri]UAK30408.1 TetR/AcrR family transcriptional regulator [Nocardia asteroides]
MVEGDGSIPGMRRWRGLSPADRVATRREQLIEACTELMATVGAAEASMRGVCRQAGLTERYFYESFPNLDALLMTVLDTVVLGARDRLLEELPNAPLERDSMFRHMVGIFTDYLLEDRRRGRIMFIESQATPVLMPRANELIGLFTAPIALVITAGDYSEPIPDEHDHALNASAIFGALAYLYRPWLDGEIPVSRERFDAHAADVIERIATARSSLSTEA